MFKYDKKILFYLTVAMCLGFGFLFIPDLKATGVVALTAVVTLCLNRAKSESDEDIQPIVPKEDIK